MPALGIAGGAIALLVYYAVGSAVLVGYLRSPRSLLRPSLAQWRFRRVLFSDILKVGLVGSVSTVATNLTIGVTTALVGGFGTAAIAGYGTLPGSNTCWCRWCLAWVRRWWPWSAPALGPGNANAPCTPPG